MQAVRMHVTCNGTSCATAKVENIRARRQTTDETIVPGLFVPATVSAVCFPGKRMLFVMADDAFGEIGHAADMARDRWLSCGMGRRLPSLRRLFQLRSSPSRPRSHGSQDRARHSGSYDRRRAA